MNAAEPKSNTGTAECVIRSRLSSTVILLVSACLLLTAGCNDEPAAPTIVPQPTGSILVLVSGSGVDFDMNGFQLLVGDELLQTIAMNSPVTVKGLKPGSYRVQIDDVTPNCSFRGNNPRSAVVVAGEVTAIVFDMVCTMVVGSVQVQVNTIGEELDDGYLVYLRNPTMLPTRNTNIGANGTITFDRIVSGTYTIDLESIAANCAATAGTRRMAALNANQTAVQVSFAIECHARGVLEINVVTTGVDLDHNGYRLSASSGRDQYNASVADPSTSLGVRLAAGNYTVDLGDVTENCEVAGGAIQRAALLSGTTTVLNLTVNCGRATSIAYAVPPIAGAAPDIHVIQSNGTGAVALTNHPGADTDPAWSPDGNRIAFTTNRDGNVEIYVMNRDGSNLQRLTFSPGDDIQPAWSPDGSRIAYSSQRDGNAEIHVMDADGAAQIRLTFDPAFDAADDTDPAWSPDGRSIAFTRDSRKALYPAIVIMNADGTNATPLNTPGDPTYGTLPSAREPAWSPDGARLAYTSVYCDWWYYIGGCVDAIMIVARSGGAGKMVDIGTAPAWSSDGRKIVYERDGIRTVGADDPRDWWTSLKSAVVSAGASPAWR